MIKVLGYIASIITIISVYKTGDKHICIWYFSMINQCIWGYIGWVTNQYYLVLLAVSLQLLNIRGLKKWKK
jgi:nicotinamide riboside transporter PnuC